MLIVMLLRMVLYAPILAIGGVLQVMKTNVSMSWIIGLAVIIIAFVVLLLFLVVMPKFKVLQNLVDKLNLVTREILTGLPVIRAFSTEKHEEERFDDANRTLTKTNLFVNRAMTFMMPVMMLVMNGVSVLIVWTGAHGISDGQMQVGDMMAFIQYTMQIIMGFLMLCMISIMLPRAAVAADRVEEVLKSETMIHDPKQEKHFPEDGKGVLTFDHVSFRYPGADEDVLEDITFTAKPGETTAIIGSTGSGKSTLVNLIPRFYDVTSGDITLDGVDIREVKHHDKYTNQSCNRCDHLSRTLVQALSKCVNIICHTGKHFTYRLCVKIAHRHAVDLLGDFSSQTVGCLLRHPRHQISLHKTADCADHIQAKNSQQNLSDFTEIHSVSTGNFTYKSIENLRRCFS